MTNIKTEASIQTVNQGRVSHAIWEMTREKAEANGTDPNSKFARTIKYKYAPVALVVYVEKKEHVKEVRKLFYDQS